MSIKCSITIMFECPFWIGLLERYDQGKYMVCKITFGPEPKDYEVYEFVLKNWYHLKFSVPVSSSVSDEPKMNPKRTQREINRLLKNKGIGTKAQQALKLQQESCKIERKEKSKKQKEEDDIRRYALRQEKKKVKHRGR